MAVIAFEAHDDDREIVGGAGSEHVLPRLLDQRLAGNGVAEVPASSFALTEAAIREDTAALLHGMVAGMQLANFVVRPQRRWVEAWAQADAWKRPSAEQLTEVATHLSGLPTAVRDDDEDAKRFDALMLLSRRALCRKSHSGSSSETPTSSSLGSSAGDNVGPGGADSEGSAPLRMNFSNTSTICA